MRIREIHIRNFRAIDQLDLVFAHPGGSTLDLAVLAGPNGCGKTSVLEACLLALKRDALLARRPLEQPYDIELALDDSSGQPFRLLRSPGQHAVVLPDGSRKPINGYLQDLKTFFFSSWRAPKLVGSVGLSTGKGKKPQQTDANSLWRLKQRLVNIKGAKSYRTPSEAEKIEVDSAFNRINKAWKEFYPAKQGSFDAEIIAPQQDRKKQDESLGEDLSFDLKLRDKDHPDGVLVDDLSSGEIEVLSMIGTFVMEKTPFDIVFIDEPELHLHMAWHRAILPALRQVAPKTQFICATHSEEILDSVYSFERFTLLPEDDPRVKGRAANPDGEDGAK
jgi:energy-coupling factor transporter ATP-binding protein EcfA2